MTARIYTIPLPEATTRDERDTLGTRLTEQGILGSDAVVERLSGEAPDLTLTGQYAFGSYYSELVASELEELADATIGGVPLYDGGRSGFYEVASADVEPVHAGGRDVWQWTLSLTRLGTRKSRFQSIETAPSQPSPGQPFGNDSTTRVGVPAAATLVRAVDSTSKPTTRLRPSPVTTLTTEFGDVDLYDVTALSIDAPTLLYDVPKDAQPAVDVRVYDTNGRSSKYIEASNGRVRAWQSVYTADHEFDDAAVVISNGRIRITIDEPTDADTTAALEAEEWDPGAGSWSAISLPTYSGSLDTDWQPADVDFVRIGQARVRAQVEFEATNGTNAGDVYAVDMQFDRGRDAVGVWIPETETDPIPTDLEALLDPIAATSVIDSNLEQGLVAREEVRL